MTPRPQRAVRPKPVKMWCAWMPMLDVPDMKTIAASKAEATRKHRHCSFGCKIVQVTITRAVRGKKRKA